MWDAAWGEEPVEMDARLSDGAWRATIGVWARRILHRPRGDAAAEMRNVGGCGMQEGNALAETDGLPR